MRAVVLNCTLKPSPQPSNTEALANEVIKALNDLKVETTLIRCADHNIMTGAKSDMGEGDAWPAILKQILGAEILIMASPTWVGQMSSVAARVLERMNGLYPVKNEETGMPVTYNKVAGFVVTGEEDGARHVVTEIAGGLMDVGFTIAPQSYTYWNNGPGPGKAYLKSDFRKEWSKEVAVMVAQNVVAVASALQKNPIQYKTQS
ncbi:flavodoxin family protein [Mucilaginibacter ginkgonis]|uniref:Flavodoxin family protein n=1 Tax=Mucilaginibacter ginkgonis TaxID=2682091 RepID=A0A6I4INW6_9SPHI|nr:flavodoxin family protein [Mucilaginibacter ginkgonis]QQL48953.1 flavodoxin family protein [Mucilaginibacter ginkgonis]